MAIVKVPVRIDYPIAGGPGYNILHFSTQPGGQAGDLGEALDALEALYTKIRGNYPIGTRITIGEGMIDDPGVSPSYVADDIRVVEGNAYGSPAPALLAIVAGWRTASATRSGRGRTFFGPLAQDVMQADGTPLDNLVENIRSACADLVGDSQSNNGWAFGILSTTTGVFRPVTGVSVKDRFAVLRSRRD